MARKTLAAQIEKEEFNVHLNGYFGKYMAHLLRGGRYGNAAELVKEALREHEIRHQDDFNKHRIEE